RRVPRRERGRPPRVGPDAGERADDDRIWDGSGRRPRPWGALVTGMTGLARPARDLAARWNPVRVTRRAARRFARRPRAMQLRTIAVVVATIAGLVVYVARAPEPPASPQPFGGVGSGKSLAPHPGPATARLAGRTVQLAASVTGIVDGARSANTPPPGPPVNQASTSARGVTGSSINVVFP